MQKLHISALETLTLAWQYLLLVSWTRHMSLHLWTSLVGRSTFSHSGHATVVPQWQLQDIEQAAYINSVLFKTQKKRSKENTSDK